MCAAFSDSYLQRSAPASFPSQRMRKWSHVSFRQSSSSTSISFATPFSIVKTASRTRKHRVSVWASCARTSSMCITPSLQKSQRAARTLLHAFKAENAFRAVFPSARIVRHVHIHWANLFARPARNAFFFVALHSQQRKITCGL